MFQDYPAGAHLEIFPKVSQIFFSRRVLRNWFSDCSTKCFKRSSVNFVKSSFRNSLGISPEFLRKIHVKNSSSNSFKSSSVLPVVSENIPPGTLQKIPPGNHYRNSLVNTTFFLKIWVSWKTSLKVVRKVREIEKKNSNNFPGKSPKNCSGSYSSNSSEGSSNSKSGNLSWSFSKNVFRSSSKNISSSSLSSRNFLNSYWINLSWSSSGHFSRSFSANYFRRLLVNSPRSSWKYVSRKLLTNSSRNFVKCRPNGFFIFKLCRSPKWITIPELCELSSINKK